MALQVRQQFSTFLGRSLQNKNMKSPNSRWAHDAGEFCLFLNLIAVVTHYIPELLGHVAQVDRVGIITE